MSSSYEGRNVYQGVYSDGKSAASHQVMVSFGGSHLEMYDGQRVPLGEQRGEPFEKWAYSDLTSVEPLHPGEAAQLGCKARPGARLYVERGDFAAELIGIVPRMSRKAANRRVLVPVLGVGAVLVSLMAAVWVSGYSIPQAIANMIPDNVRKGMGRQVIAGMSGGRAACTGEAGSRAFAKLLARVSEGSGQSDKFDVKIIRIGMMNAFAAPGELVVVSKKLVDFVKSPEELAGVIAHEVGHGIKKHPEAGIVRALGISAGINIAFGGSTGGIGDIGAMLLQFQYSRSAEFEADAIALDILQRAEIPAAPFASFFARLEEKKRGRSRKKAGAGGKRADSKGTGGNGTGSKGKEGRRAGGEGLSRTLALLSTHPSSPERIARIEAQPDWKTRPLLSAKEWQDLRNICRDDEKKNSGRAF